MTNQKQIKTNQTFAKFRFSNTIKASLDEGVTACLNFCIPEISQSLAGGLRKSSINIIAANTGCGKSWLATNQAVTTANSGKYTLIISTELGQTEMLARIISIITKIEIFWIDSINDKRYSFLTNIIKALSSEQVYTREMIQELDPDNYLRLKEVGENIDPINIFRGYQDKYKNITEFLCIIYDIKIEDMFDNIVLLSTELQNSEKVLDMIVIDHCDFMSSKNAMLNRDELSRDAFFLEQLFQIVRNKKLTALVVKQMSKPVNRIADVNASESDLIRGTRHWQYLSSAIFLLLETTEQKDINYEMGGNLKQLTLCLGKRRTLGAIHFDSNGKFIENPENIKNSKKVYGKNHEITYKQSTGEFAYIRPTPKTDNSYGKR